jgi:hypothetical protein
MASAVKTAGVLHSPPRHRWLRRDNGRFHPASPTAGRKCGWATDRPVWRRRSWQAFRRGGQVCGPPQAQCVEGEADAEAQRARDGGEQEAHRVGAQGGRHR